MSFLNRETERLGNNLESIAKSFNKPWYTRPEFWLSLIAALTGIISVIATLLGK